MPLFLQILFLLITYLIGSIPFGYLVVQKQKGINIRNYGSGNIGSTNVRRLVGRKASVITQLLDMLKGLIPVAAYLIVANAYNFNYDFVYLVGITSIIGHDFSIFLRFKGGKGVNTTMGAGLLLDPLSILSSVVIYYLVKWKTSYVSAGSLAIALFLPLISFILHAKHYLLIYFMFCSFLIIVLHRKNIKRLMQGAENQ